MEKQTENIIKKKTEFLNLIKKGCLLNKIITSKNIGKRGRICGLVSEAIARKKELIYKEEV